MIATAFMGYSLVWGQMSFWAVTVITNLFSSLDAVIPGLGTRLVQWIWGGFAVGDPTLNRLYSLHYLFPFVIAGVVVLHIWALHMPGNNNPTGIDVKGPRDTVPFHPYYTIKDGFALVLFALFFRGLRVLRAEPARPSRQLHPGQSAADAAAHRAGMVLPAVLRDPARDPEQAVRRRRRDRRDRHPVLRALARHLARALDAATGRSTNGSSGRSWSPASCSAISARSRRKALYLMFGRIFTAYYFLFFLVSCRWWAGSRSRRRCRAASPKSVLGPEEAPPRRRNLRPRRREAGAGDMTKAGRSALRVIAGALLVVRALPRGCRGRGAVAAATPSREIDSQAGASPGRSGTSTTLSCSAASRSTRSLLELPFDAASVLPQSRRDRAARNSRRRRSAPSPLRPK